MKKGIATLLGILVLSLLVGFATSVAAEGCGGTIVGHAENGTGKEVQLYTYPYSKVKMGSTIVDANGDYKFENVPSGEYLVYFVGKGSLPVSVVAGKKTLVIPVHWVVEGDTLWDIFGPHTWERFVTLSRGFGMKYHTNEYLVVIIRPGQLFVPSTQMLQVTGMPKNTIHSKR